MKHILWVHEILQNSSNEVLQNSSNEEYTENKHSEGSNVEIDKEVGETK